MFKITFLEDRKFTGTYLSVTFKDGEGQTDSNYLAERFEKKGLLVEKVVEEEVLNCPHCEKEYKSQATLDKHIKDKHPEGDGADA